MSLSLYDVSVPVFRQYLAGLSGVLAKAEAHCASGAVAEADIIGFRLYEDMLPFTFQVVQAIFHGAGAVGTLRGQPYPRAEGLEQARAAVGGGHAADPEHHPLSAHPGGGENQLAHPAAGRGQRREAAGRQQGQPARLRGLDHGGVAEQRVRGRHVLTDGAANP